MRQSVLILGGSYFIGKNIASTFMHKGYQVSVLNRGFKPAEDGIEQIICDRGNAEELKKALRDRHFDVVVDVSWKEVSWVRFLCDALSFDSVKAFIFISSSAVYDLDHLAAPYHETDPLAVNKIWTWYGQGKIEAESYYSSYLKNKNPRLVILRPPYVYGEDNYAQRESLIFKHLYAGDPILIPKSECKLQFIYVKDLARIVLTLSERLKEKAAIYNLGNQKTHTPREWVETCGKAAGIEPMIIECDYKALHRSERDFFPFFDYDNVLDVHKIKQLIPQETPIEDGLASAYQWYLDNRDKINFKPYIEQNISELITLMS